MKIQRLYNDKDSNNNNKRIAKNTLLPNSNLIVYEAMHIAWMLK